VVSALKAQLTDPRGIERYLATYLSERRRLAKIAATKQTALERQLAEAKREIERVVDGIARGTLSDEEARCRLVEPRRRRDQAEAELAQLKPPPKTVTLHPGIIKRYLAAVDDLAGTLGRRIVEGNEECATALRELVVAVIVLPEQHRAEPRIEVRACYLN
jgi:site-specific DNA recombinase